MERRHPAGIISENPTITTEVLAWRIGISTRAVEKHLSNLKAKGLLSRIGPDKGGHWEVAEGYAILVKVKKKSVSLEIPRIRSK